MRTVLVYTIALGAVAIGCWLGFPELFAATAAADAKPSRAPKAVPPVVVARVARAPFVDTLSALGTVHANESVAVTSNRADHVAAIHFDDGQHVSKGDLLVEMHAKEEQALLTEASAVRDDRHLNHERSKELFDKSLLSEREYLATKALLAASEARVLSLEAAIADRKIHAPFAGVLGLRRVSVGAYVQPSTVITTLDDLSVIKLDFTIPEVWLPTVRPGMKVLARCVAWPDEGFGGEVTTIDTRLDPRTRSATIRAKLPNPGLKLRPGMLMTVAIQRGLHSVLQVPEEALIPIGEEQFVYRVGDQGIAHKVTVTIGRRRVGSVEITDGLEEDDQVVIEGIVRVRPGSPVKVVKVLNPKS